MKNGAASSLVGLHSNRHHLLVILWTGDELRKRWH